MILISFFKFIIGSVRVFKRARDVIMSGSNNVKWRTVQWVCDVLCYALFVKCAECLMLFCYWWM